MNAPRWLTTISPLAATLSDYRREHFVGDLMAGLVVAIMLVPQAMAYAMLAGLPPEVGLYASLLPLVLYAIFGTSNSLAVGPVAMVSLLVVSGVGELAEPGSTRYLQLCFTLAMLVGVLQIVMALFRFGFLVNFISHPVLVGFTSAAAIVIGFSQLKHLFGVSVATGDYPFQMILNTLREVGAANLTTLAIGLGSCLLLIGFRWGLAPGLQRLGLGKGLATTLAKAGPLAAVAITALLVGIGRWDSQHAVAVVGDIPAGLPRWSWPDFSISTIQSLFPLALVITVVGYLESFSVAKALAGRRRERVDPNRELFALGMADLGAAFTGGYPVTGGFSRSLVNFSAGVRTPLGSVFTALLVGLAVLVLTPLFYFVPKAVLAAIIVVAVAGLIDWQTPLRLWKFSRADAAALWITFGSVLGLGIEQGILIGVASTVLLQMWRMSRPHVAEVGRIGSSEHFRNLLRHDVQSMPGLLALRMDESLNFANAPFLESYVLDQLAARPEIRNVLLISSGINDIDATGLEVLQTITRELQSAGTGFYMSEVKGPVTDRLERAGFDTDFLKTHVFLSTHQAVCQLTGWNAPPQDLPTDSSSSAATMPPQPTTPQPTTGALS